MQAYQILPGDGIDGLQCVDFPHRELGNGEVRIRVHAASCRFFHDGIGGLQDFLAGRVGKTVRSRSGKNLAPHRPKRVFDRTKVAPFTPSASAFGRLRPNWGLG